MNLSDKIMDTVTVNYDGIMTDISEVFSIGPVRNPIENGVFNTDLDNLLEPNQTLGEDSNITLKNGEISKCAYSNLAELGTRNYYTIHPDERILFFTNVRCKEIKEVIINFGVGHRIRVWVNNKFICSNILFSNCFLAMKLQEGDNIFIVECESVYTGSRLGMRINEYNDELFGINSKLASGIEARLVNDFSIVVKESVSAKNSSTFEFMLMPKDKIDIPSDTYATASVYDKYGNKFDEFQVQICEHYIYDVKSKKMKVDSEPFISFDFTFNTVSGKQLRIKHNILTVSIDDELTNLKSRYTKISKRYLTEEDKVNIERRLSNIERLITGIPPSMITEDDLRDKSVTSQVIELYKIFETIEDGYHFSDLVIRNEISHVYYQSYLDDHIEMYSISLPPNYTYDKKYPLLIFIPVCSPDAPWSYLRTQIDEDVIMVDVSIKGWTLGSYIGEMTFFESINRVLHQYNIDENRIYLIGHSNGGYATFTLSQNYPHMFAAVVPIACTAYLPSVKNLINVNVLSVYAEHDNKALVDSMEQVKNELKPYGRYEEIIAHNSPHNSVWVAMYSKHVLKWLLKHRKPVHPPKVHYRTERIRHHKAYWIEILKMEPGKNDCEIVGEIYDDSNIIIKSEGVDEFSIDIPDNMKNKELNITLNSNHICTTCRKEEPMRFVNSEGIFYIKSDIPKAYLTSGSQGMGVLDIFMDRLKIVVPSVYANYREKKCLTHIANEFSNPTTQGLYLTLRIDYPVLSDTEISNRDINQCNLILLGLNGTNFLFEKILDLLPIKCNENGYQYQDDFVYGTYSISFICQNPLNKNHKMLIIHSNDYRLFQKNLVTRKVIIPTYMNGSHPLLSNEVVVYDGYRYMVAYQIGDDLKPLGL